MKLTAEKPFEAFNEVLAFFIIWTLPVAVCSLVKVLYVAKKYRNFKQMLPLIGTQLVTIYIWTCQGCVLTGYYRLIVSNQRQVQGDTYRNFFIRLILNFSIYLDPVGVFLYTWQLIPTLMIETKHRLLSKIYYYYHRASIWIVPITFLVLYVSLSSIFATYFKLRSEE